MIILVDAVPFFEAMANEMNEHPERFTVLGDADMVAALVMHRPDGSAFVAELVFAALRCEGVQAVGVEEARLADFRMEGPLDAWQTMFDDIRTHGAASGRQTINSLVLVGDAIKLRGDDPMGVDKFSRFNQTLQEYFDGAARVAVAVTS